MHINCYRRHSEKESKMENPPRRRTQLDFTDTISKTEQHHLESCNMQFILTQAQKTGMIEHIRNDSPRYETLATKVDYLESMKVIAEANSVFETLPAKIREKFENKAENFLEYLAKEENVKRLANEKIQADELVEGEKKAKEKEKEKFEQEVERRIAKIQEAKRKVEKPTVEKSTDSP